MKRLELEKELINYKRILDELENQDEASNKYPAGSLRISVDKSKTRYFHCLPDMPGAERYIPVEEMVLAKQLAQKTYDEKLLKLVKKRLGQLNRILKDYDEYEIDKLFDELHPERKKLVKPIEKTVEQKYKEWLDIEYRGKEFNEGTPLIYTKKDERVRSKTERDMANYFFDNKIEYKYEKPLFLKGFGTVYPDFTFFSKQRGEEIYWEHDGRMDDPDYAKKAVKKIEAYEDNGIYIGERLIVTFETVDKILNIKEIEMKTNKYLK